MVATLRTASQDAASAFYQQHKVIQLIGEFTRRARGLFECFLYATFPLLHFFYRHLANRTSSRAAFWYPWYIRPGRDAKLVFPDSEHVGLPLQPPKIRANPNMTHCFRPSCSFGDPLCVDIQLFCLGWWTYLHPCASHVRAFRLSQAHATNQQMHIYIYVQSCDNQQHVL